VQLTCAEAEIILKEFNPIEDIENSNFALDGGEWPSFHDAEIHKLSIWRGDLRPDDDVWIWPVIEITLELCAGRNPYRVVLKFHGCESIKLEGFNHQNAINGLIFKFKGRGTFTKGEPLPPIISVNFEQAFGASLSFECSTVQAINCNEECLTSAESGTFEVMS